MRLFLRRGRETYKGSGRNRWIEYRVDDNPLDVGVDGLHERYPVALASWPQDGLYVFLGECERRDIQDYEVTISDWKSMDFEMLNTTQF